MGMDYYFYKILRLLKKVNSRNYRYFLSGLKGLVKCGSYEAKIYRNVSITYPKNITIKGKIILYPFVRINNFHKGDVFFANNIQIFSHTTIESAGGKIVIGENVIIGEYSTIQGQGNVYIEKNVLLASHIHLITNSHYYEDINTPIKYQSNISAPITIREGAWIGINVTILKGVTIGKNAVIGAGSIVKNDIPDYSVAVGCPAKVVKFFDFNQNKWVKSHE